jgi:hypothetical protein
MERCRSNIVTPAQAGVKGNRTSPGTLDSRLRGNDDAEISVP